MLIWCIDLSTGQLLFLCHIGTVTRGSNCRFHYSNVLARDKRFWISLSIIFNIVLAFVPFSFQCSFGSSSCKTTNSLVRSLTFRFLSSIFFSLTWRFLASLSAISCLSFCSLRCFCRCSFLLLCLMSGNRIYQDMLEKSFEAFTKFKLTFLFSIFSTCSTALRHSAINLRRMPKKSAVAISSSSPK